MKISPTGAALGADVWDIQLDRLDNTTFQDIYQAWLDHNGVLRFPCQDLNDDNFLTMMQKEIGVSLPRNTSGDRRQLYKQIIDFYKLNYFFLGLII